MLLERVDRHPVRVHLDLHDVGLVGAERRHRARVGGRLGDDHVARVDQRLAHQVDHLLAAGRDDHVGRVDRSCPRRPSPRRCSSTVTAIPSVGPYCSARAVESRGDLAPSASRRAPARTCSCRAGRRRARSRPGARSAPSSRASPSFSSRACARRTAPRSAPARARWGAFRARRVRCRSLHFRTSLFAAAPAGTSRSQPSSRGSRLSSCRPVAGTGTVAHDTRNAMNGLFFYIGLGVGLAAACGLRPFLPALLAGALGSADALGVDFRSRTSTSCRRAGGCSRSPSCSRSPTLLQLLPRARRPLYDPATPCSPRATRSPRRWPARLRRRRAAVRRHARRARRRLPWPGLLGGARGRRARPARVRPDDRGRARAPARPRRARSADALPRRRRAAARGARLRCCIRSATCCSRCSRGWSCAPALARRREVRRPAHPAVAEWPSREAAKLVLCVIDAMAPAMLERTVAAGTAPVLETLIERGRYVPDCVAAFPSVTPVCAASIVTGVAPGRAPHPGDELVPPRGGALRRVRLELPRRAALRDRPAADRHRLQHEPRAPLAGDADRVRVARRRRRPHGRHHLPDVPRPPPPRARSATPRSRASPRADAATP